MKKCTSCKKTKQISDFYNSKSSKDGKSYRCKSCDKSARNLYRQRNKETATKNQRKAYLKSKYGITEEQEEGILKEQNYLCAICNTKGFKMRSEAKYSLVVDHCHSSGEVRGMLCHNCNRGLGLFKDNTKYLEKAIRYLNKNAQIH